MCIWSFLSKLQANFLPEKNHAVQCNVKKLTLVRPHWIGIHREILRSSALKKLDQLDPPGKESRDPTIGIGTSSTQSCQIFSSVPSRRGQKLPPFFQLKPKTSLKTPTHPMQKKRPPCVSPKHPETNARFPWFFWKSTSTTRVPTKTFLGIWFAILIGTIAVIWIRLLQHPPKKHG